MMPLSERRSLVISRPEMSIRSEFMLDQSIQLSMDGKGRATDNAFIERLWRTVK